MKKLLKYSLLALLLVLAVISCVKELKQNAADADLTGPFTPMQAKHWYNQSFVQTNSFKVSWQQSKKTPAWRDPVYKKMGDQELLEFPLLKQHSSLFVPHQNLSSTQLRQIVNASLKKVVFIKGPGNRIVIREIDYIPDWNYLQQQSFDISKASLGAKDDKFSGVVEVKDWTGVLISMRRVENGKVTKRISRSGSSQGNARTTSCGYVEYCMWYEDCEVIGDQWTDNCGEPYMDPNDCYYEYECDGDEDPCEMYGDCGDGGGGGGGGDDPGVTPNPVDEVKDSLNDPCRNAALNSIAEAKLKNFVTSFYNNYLVGTDSKFNLVIKEAPDITVNGQPAVAYTTNIGGNTWEITLSTTYYSGSGYNMSQQAWAEIIAHEIIHVAIAANNINPGGNDHALMFKNFIDPLKDLLHDGLGLSESDALGLALSGMNDLWGYPDFNQLCIDTYGMSTTQVQQVLDAYTKGNSGTKC